MKILAHLGTNQLVISRLTTVSGYKKAYATATACIANIQPLSLQKTQLYGGAMGKTFTIYVDGNVDIEEGDRLRDTQTQEVYQVVNGGVSRRTFGNVDYDEVVVEKLN